MLAQVKVPVLFTHHARVIDPATGQLSGAISDLQATKVREIVTAAGQPFEYVSLPDAAHAMHQVDPARFAQVLTTWAKNFLREAHLADDWRVMWRTSAHPSRSTIVTLAWPPPSHIVCRP